eukprot:7946367-Pyramimonas_sp.AAC.1
MNSNKPGIAVTIIEPGLEGAPTHRRVQASPGAVQEAAPTVKQHNPLEKAISAMHDALPPWMTSHLLRAIRESPTLTVGTGVCQLPCSSLFPLARRPIRAAELADSAPPLLGADSAGPGPGRSQGIEPIQAVCGATGCRRRAEGDGGGHG